MSIADVSKAQRAYNAAMLKATWARKHRDAAVVAALEARLPQSQIMLATGLSRARLVQIRKGTR